MLLGAHPPILPVRAIVRTTELFDINEGTTRVALSRLVADQDVVADDSGYRLSDRLLARQQRLDEGRSPATRPWRGAWEMAVVGPEVQSAAGRASVGGELAALRLAELRSGVWTRPANLRRAWPNSLQDLVWCFEVRPGPAPGTSGGPSAGRAASRKKRPAEGSTLAASLWDLQGWAGHAEALLRAFTAESTPARRFMTAAAIVRHLQSDPLLPKSLLPDHWPGPRLRQAYAGYEHQLIELFRREQRRHG